MNWKTYANSTDMAFEYGANAGNQNAFYVNPDYGSAPAAGKFAVVMSGTSTRYNGASITRPSSNAWHHMSIVMDRTTGTNIGTTIYMDGTNQVQTLFQTNDLGGAVFSATSIGLNFMSRNGSSLFGNGQLQDVRIYNRALSSNEVHAIWSATRL